MRLACIALLCLAAPARALDDAAAAQALELARQRVASTAASLDSSRSPSFTGPDGRWNSVANTDLLNWTQGFFPGEAWYVADLTGDSAARATAAAWTRALENQKTNTQTHDLGFKMFLSYGHAWRSTGDPYYRDVLLTAAGSLASRYDASLGVVVCCDWNPDWHRPVVIDTMMNLELLLWGAQNGGPAGWRDAALNHALRTLRDLVRPDGSTYHVVDYSSSGAILFRGTSQGYSDSSTWTRGQAWAIYGFTVVYRYTADPRMLAAAQQVTEEYLARLGTDAIPNWDFDAPPGAKDSSAAAAVAAALFELAGYVGAADGQRYQQAASAMLDALASPDYLDSAGATQALLLHGTANYPASEQVDVGLIYGDHYFLEALARRPASPPLDGGDAGRTGAAPDGGTRATLDAGSANDAGAGGVIGPGDGGTAPSGASTVGSAPAPRGCTSGPEAGFAAALAFALLAAARRRPDLGAPPELPQRRPRP